MAAKKSPWGPVPLQPGEQTRATLGPLRMWIRRVETDWFYAVERPEEAPATFGWEPVQEAPEKLDWNRLGCEKPSRRILLEPALPNRAVVVRPEVPFTILPGDRIRFFIPIPLWVRLVAQGTAKPVWCDLPTQVLSKSWFGTVEVGEAAYAMRTPAVRTLEEVPRDQDRIICPVRLRNQSADVLRFDRMCLRVQHLNIYQGKTSLWTNEAGLTYRGNNEWSRVAFGRSGPPYDNAERQLAEARDPSRGTFSLKSIASGELFT